MTCPDGVLGTYRPGQRRRAAHHRRRQPRPARQRSLLRQTRRHRLNRGGDRRANAALHRIAISRLRTDKRTRDYLDRRTTQGLTRREATRCVKRYIARELYHLIRQLNITDPGPRAA